MRPRLRRGLNCLVAWHELDWPAVDRLEHQFANNTNLVHLHRRLDLVVENHFGQDYFHLEHGEPLANAIPGPGTEWDISKRVALERVLGRKSIRIKHFRLGIIFWIVVQGVNVDAARAPLWQEMLASITWRPARR